MPSRKDRIQSQLGAPPPMRPLPDRNPRAGDPQTEAARQYAEEQAQKRAAEAQAERARQAGEDQLAHDMSFRGLIEGIADTVDPLGAYTDMLPREVSRAVNMAKGRPTDMDLYTDEDIRVIAENQYQIGREAREKRTNDEIIQLIEKGAQAQKAEAKVRKIQALRPGSPRVQAAQRRYR